MTNIHSQWNDCMYRILQCKGNENSIPHVKWRANWYVINSSTCQEVWSRHRTELLNDRNTEDCVIDCDVEVHKHSSRTYRKRCGLTASTLIHGPNYVVQHLQYSWARFHRLVLTQDVCIILGSSSILSWNRDSFVCVRFVTNIKSNLDVSKDDLNDSKKRECRVRM